MLACLMQTNTCINKLRVFLEVLNCLTFNIDNFINWKRNLCIVPPKHLLRDPVKPDDIEILSANLILNRNSHIYIETF